VTTVPERRVATQRTQEGLLERVLRSRLTEPPRQEREDLVAVPQVERLERRDDHNLHHPL
jgi:hypothetical protein